MIWTFIAGIFVGVNLSGFIYWAQLRRIRDADREFRAEQRKKLDELSEWSARQFAQARRDAWLPPRSAQ